MTKLLAFIQKQPNWLILIICLLLSISIGMVDYITADLSITLFYIIPVFLAVWMHNRNAGLCMALLVGVELLTVDRLRAASNIPLLSVRTWNSIMEALFLLLTAYILATLKNEMKQKKKRADELEAANLELDAFNYSVSHDLRKPLTSINGYSQLIMELYGDKIDEQGRDYLNEIYKAALRMEQLIDALLNFSRLAQSEVCMEKTDLSETAKIIVAELRLAETSRKVEIEIAEGITASGDPKLLRIVLENLIGNAWKYTGKKADAVISFGMKMSGGKATYYVRDNGAGFDASQADKLFIPFQRLRGAEEFAGFGIGLATVKRIIQRHGGQIWAESEEGKGSAFYFTLPVQGFKGI